MYVYLFEPKSGKKLLDLCAKKHRTKKSDLVGVATIDQSSIRKLLKDVFSNKPVKLKPLKPMKKKRKKVTGRQEKKKQSDDDEFFSSDEEMAQDDVNNIISKFSKLESLTSIYNHKLNEDLSSPKKKRVSFEELLKKSTDKKDPMPPRESSPKKKKPSKYAQYSPTYSSPPTQDFSPIYASSPPQK